jgi:hypothetical protein
LRKLSISRSLRSQLLNVRIRKFQGRIVLMIRSVANEWVSFFCTSFGFHAASGAAQ